MSVRYRVTAAPQASGYSEAGASYKRRALRAFFPNSNSPSSDIHDNADILRQRSRMLYMSAPVATSAINTNRTKIVGTGLTLKATVDRNVLGLSPEKAKEWQSKTEAEFRLWAENRRSCDAMGLNDFYGLQQLALKSWLKRKTGLSETVLLHMMSDTTYMTGKEAVEKGFANELLDDAEPVEISASADRQTIYAKGHALHLRPGTKLPGNIPMAKAAAPATATANTPAAPAAQSNEGGHTTMATTIEELRKENPELCRQLEQSASEQASQNERTRLSEIDEVANLFDPTMVQEAKYGNTACDARELAFRAAKAAAAQGHEFLKNLAADNQASGAQGVEAVPGASATGDPESLPDATGNAPKTPAERMAAADAAVAALLDGDEKK